MYPGASLWLLLTLSLPLLAHPANSPPAPLPAPASSNPETSWGDWLIVDEAEPGASILLRRITPKSVFIAPTVCSEGYRQDSMGRCVKVVKINQQAQWNFLLERLNSMYAPSSGTKNPQKEAGPFHISLPIGSENSQEDANIKKRVPPATTTTTSSTTTSTTTPVPPCTTQSTTLPPLTTTMMPESLIPEVSSTDKDYYSPTESTTERRDVSTEKPSEGAMFADQPVVTENFMEVETFQTPKNHREDSSQLPEKPFVIIVTNKPVTRGEETTVPTTYVPLTSAETVEEETSETPSTTEVTTEGTTETTLRYTTDIAPRTTTDYDESASESVSMRPAATRPKCDPRVTRLRDDLMGPSDCEPAAEIVSKEKEFVNPSESLPASYQPNSRIRFPSEAGYVQDHRIQSYVKFPETASPERERPSYWYPSWHVQEHPMIRGWPPSDQVLQRQYPPPYTLSGHMWAEDANIWRRRFLQRD